MCPSSRRACFGSRLPRADPALVLDPSPVPLGRRTAFLDTSAIARCCSCSTTSSRSRGRAGTGRARRECPNLRLLVTSRERLRVSGETDSGRTARCAGCDRALQRRARGLEPDDAIAELCRLSTTCRSRSSWPPLARASFRRPDPGAPRRSARPLQGRPRRRSRQQTLRGTIEWSHDLLGRERQLFARLAVFAGGCTLEAAEEIVGADVDTLQSLVDKSLVRHSETLLDAGNHP